MLMQKLTLRIHKSCIISFVIKNDTPPNSLTNSIASPKGENNGKIRNWACSLAHNTLRVEGACWSFRMGIKKSDKRVNY